MSPLKQHRSAVTSGTAQADNAKQKEVCAGELGSKLGKYSDPGLGCQRRGAEVFPLCGCYFWYQMSSLMALWKKKFADAAK